MNSIIVPGRKLGRLPYRHDPRTLRFGEVWFQQLAVPDSADWTHRVTVPWGIMGNDTKPDCAVAGAGHEEMAWTGGLFVPADDQIDQDWRLLDPESRGCVLLDVLKYWRNHGIAGHTIGAFASIRPGNVNHLKSSIAFLEGVYGGWCLPDAWFQSEQGQPWDAGYGVKANPDNGHCMPILAYDADGVDVITWGYVQRITWAGVQLALDEAWAIFAPDMLDPTTGLTPIGLNVDQLNKDLSLL